MKRILSILLLAVYVVLAAGVTVQQHTCGGSTTADLAPLPLEDPCGCDPWESPSDRCCTVQVMEFQIHDGQDVPAIVWAPTLDAMPIVYAAVDAPIVDDASFTPNLFIDTSPTRSVPATILNCSFLI